MVGFGEAISLFFRNYVNFEGRASRAEFWWSALFQIIVYISIFILAVIAQAFLGSPATDGYSSPAAIMMISMAIFYLICWLPRLSIKVRRFHDLDQTGWLVLVFILANAFVIFSWFAQMIWFAMPGTQGPNQYGSNHYGKDPFGFDADIFG